jgi:polyisoprenoid-binding protein YceI
MLGLMPVKGKFTKFDGGLKIDEQGNASGELRVVTESIETGIAKRDTHLRTEDFFHSAVHPQMIFTLDRLATDRGGQMTAVGVLKIRDKQLDVVAPAQLTKAADGSLELRAEFDVDHKAAGLGWAKPGMVPGRVRVLTTVGLVRA